MNKRQETWWENHQDEAGNNPAIKITRYGRYEVRPATSYNRFAVVNDSGDLLSDDPDDIVADEGYYAMSDDGSWHGGISGDVWFFDSLAEAREKAEAITYPGYVLADDMGQYDAENAVYWIDEDVEDDEDE